MEKIDIDVFLKTNKKILDNPLWIYEKSEVTSKLSEKTNYNYKVNVKTAPKLFRMEDIYSTLWVSSGTFFLSSIFLIGFDALFHWAEKDVAKRTLSIYLIYSAIFSKSSDFPKIIDNIAFDISAKYFLRYKNKAEKKFSPNIGTMIFDSIKLINQNDWSFRNMVEKGSERIDKQKEEYIINRINLMTIAYITNCYYLFDLSESEWKQLLKKYTFKYYWNLLDCNSDNSHDFDLSIREIDNEYDCKKKFRQAFHDKYTQIFESREIMKYIEDENE